MSKAVTIWLLFVAAAAPAATPQRVVEVAVQRVIVVLESAEPGRATERARIEIRRILADLFDFEEIGRRALLRHWASRTPAEQAEVIALVGDRVEQAWVSRIEAWASDTIVYTGEVVDGEYARVRSRVLTGGRDDATVEYRLRRRGGRWRVYDLLVDSVSFVATYRGELQRILRSSSSAALVDRLKRRRLDIRAVVGSGRPASSRIDLEIRSPR